MSEVRKEHALPPVGALRRIGAILADTAMAPASRIATAAVVLCAKNRTGLAFPGYRWISNTFGISSDAIRRALAVPESGQDKPCGQAIGRHLEPAGRGPRGVQQFRVLPIPRESDGSAPADSALDKGQRTCFGGSAHLSADASAPVSAGQRTAGQCETSVRELALRTGGGTAPLPLDARALDGNNNSGNGTDGGDGRLVAYWEHVRGRAASDGEARAFLEAVREARSAGAPDRVIAHYVWLNPNSTPWAGPNAARDAVRAALADFQRLPRLAEVTLVQVPTVEYDPTVPDGLVKQADLDDLRRKHAEVLKALGPGKGENGFSDDFGPYKKRAFLDSPPDGFSRNCTP